GESPSPLSGDGTPGVPAPDGSVPGVSSPGVPVPGGSVPGVSSPGVPVPGGSVPGDSGPESPGDGVPEPGAPVSVAGSGAGGPSASPPVARGRSNPIVPSGSTRVKEEIVPFPESLGWISVTFRFSNPGQDRPV